MGRAVTRELEGKAATDLQPCPQKEPEPLREMVRQNPGAAFLRLKYKLMQKTKLKASPRFPGGAISEEPACQCKRQKRQDFNPWVGKIPWRRAWQPIVFLPGESHGQRSLVGYSPWGCRELDITEATWHAHGHSPVGNFSLANVSESLASTQFVQIYTPCSAFLHPKASHSVLGNRIFYISSLRLKFQKGPCFLLSSDK